MFPALEANWQRVNDHNHDGINSALLSSEANLPSQTGNSGKFLTTNGTAASWGSIPLQIKNCLVIDTSAQVIVPNTYTKITFNTTEKDPYSLMVSSGKFQIPAGPSGDVYGLITFACALDPITTISNHRCTAVVYKNGAPYKFLGEGLGSNTLGLGTGSVFGSCKIVGVSGDYFEVYVQHTNTSNLKTSTGSLNMSFSLEY